jgi:hypothetical protein
VGEAVLVALAQVSDHSVDRGVVELLGVDVAEVAVGDHVERVGAGLGLVGPEQVGGEVPDSVGLVRDAGAREEREDHEDRHEERPQG